MPLYINFYLYFFKCLDLGNNKFDGRKKKFWPLVLVYVFYLAILRCRGNFLCVCREMEYIIPFLFVLASKRFCWGSIDVVCLPGASAVPQAWRSQSAGNGGKKMVLKRSREFCYFCALFCLGSASKK